MSNLIRNEKLSEIFGVPINPSVFIYKVYKMPRDSDFIT